MDFRRKAAKLEVPKLLIREERPCQADSAGNSIDESRGGPLMQLMSRLTALDGDFPCGRSLRDSLLRVDGLTDQRDEFHDLKKPAHRDAGEL